MRVFLLTLLAVSCACASTLRSREPVEALLEKLELLVKKHAEKSDQLNAGVVLNEKKDKVLTGIEVLQAQDKARSRKDLQKRLSFDHDDFPECVRDNGPGNAKVLRGPTGTITSPNYPAHYPATSTCRYRVAAGEGKGLRVFWNSIDVEDGESCPHDSVKLFEKVSGEPERTLKGTHCGQTLPDPITLNGDLIVVLRTDELVSGLGFSLNWEEFDTVSPCTTGAHYEATVPNEIVSPVGDPTTGHYPNNANCFWVINNPQGRTVTITFDRFELEYSEDPDCHCDALTIHEGQSDQVSRRHCGRDKPASFTSTAATITLTLTTDSSLTYPGFALHYSSTDGAGQPGGGGSADCGGTLTAAEGTFTSPNYPDNYPDNVTCVWTITAPQGQVVELEVTDFELEKEDNCIFDSLSIKDGDIYTYDPFCDERPSMIVTQSNTLVATFISDISTNFKGFSANYKFVTAGGNGGSGGTDGQCGGTLTSPSGTFQTPNYPSKYPSNSNCEWTITTSPGKVIQLQFNKETFNLEVHDSCDYDSVRVTDGGSVHGPYCSSDELPDRIVSKTNVLRVTFSSDLSEERTGFAASYTTADGGSSGGDSGDGGSTWSTTGTCGKPDPAYPIKLQSITNQKIVGGAEANAHSLPWQIHLLFYGNGGCGGTIVNENWVITAAHCTRGQSASSLSIRAGAHDRYTATNVQTIQVAEIKQHPDYDQATTNNDIALLKLETPLQFNQYVKPICLNTLNPTDKQGQYCIVSGWGRLSSGGSSPNKLNQVYVPIITNEACRDQYGTGKITDNMMCAGQPQGGIDSCQGDSGGPLVCKEGDSWYLAGVVSWGYGCAQAAFAGVYARVHYFKDWIVTNSDGAITF